MEYLQAQVDEWEYIVETALAMRTVQLKRTTLLAKLKENRAAQEAKQKTALENWQTQLKGRIETIGKDIAAGKFPTDVLQLISDLQRPQDVLKLYDDAIEMVGLDERDQLELNQQEFKQFWQDDWEWKRQWAGSNSKYLSS